MPVCLLGRGDCPSDGTCRETLPHVRVLGDVAVIVIIDERMPVHRIVERECNQREKKRRNRDWIFLGQQQDLNTEDAGDTETFSTRIYVIT